MRAILPLARNYSQLTMTTKKDEGNGPSEDEGIELDENSIIYDLSEFLEETRLNQWWKEMPEAIEELHQWIDETEERTGLHYRTILEYEWTEKDGPTGRKRIVLEGNSGEDHKQRIWFEYRGVVVYYHYKDGLGRVRNCWFNTNVAHDEFLFDIRNIAKDLDYEYAIGRENALFGFIYEDTKQGSKDDFVPWPKSAECAKGCIILAIRKGLLLPPDISETWVQRGYGYFGTGQYVKIPEPGCGGLYDQDGNLV